MESEIDLITAAGQNQFAVTKRLIEVGVSLNQSHVDGYTALMAAAQNGNLRIAELLLSAGAAVDVVDRNGQTALMFSCRRDCFDLTKLLLEAGADVNKKVSVDSSHFPGFTALHFCAIRTPFASSDISDLLIQNGAEVDAKDDLGETPLMKAAYGGQIALVRLLVDRGSSIDHVDNEGLKAIDFARKIGHSQIETHLERR